MNNTIIFFFLKKMPGWIPTIEIRKLSRFTKNIVELSVILYWQQFQVFEPPYENLRDWYSIED